MAKASKEDDGSDGEEGERHSRGSFYTPEHITRYNASKAIGARAFEGLMSLSTKGYTSLDEALTSAPVRDLIPFYFTVLKGMRVVDPACGDGAFLVPCLETLVDMRSRCLETMHRRRTKDARVAEELELADGGGLGGDVLRGSIYGVDLDEGAVVACRTALAKAAGKGRSRTIADANIRVGNSLLGYVHLPVQTQVTDYFARADGRKDGGGDGPPSKEDLDGSYINRLSKRIGKGARAVIPAIEAQPLFHWPQELPSAMAAGGFDVVIGNPPYGDRALSKEERTAVKALLPLTTVTDGKGKGSVNPSSVFIERAHDLLLPDGQLSFIVPSSMTRVQEFEKVRRFLLDRTFLWHIVDEGAPFEDVTLEMVSMFARKGRRSREREVAIMSRRREGASRTVPLTSFRKYDRFMLYWDETYDRIADGSLFGIISGRRGPTLPRNRYDKGEDGAHPVPLLVSGRAIQRYRLVPSEFHWAQERVLASPEVEAVHSSSILVGTRLTDRYRVCIKPPGHIIGDNIIRLDHDAGRLSPEALSVILNSRLMAYVVRRYLFNDSTLTLFIQSVTDATPIRVPRDREMFTAIGAMMTELGRGWPATSDLMDGMDARVADPLVYDLYLNGGDLGIDNMVAAVLEAIPDEGGPAERAKALIEAVGRDDALMAAIGRVHSDPVVARMQASP